MGTCAIYSCVVQVIHDLQLQGMVYTAGFSGVRVPRWARVRFSFLCLLRTFVYFALVPRNSVMVLLFYVFVSCAVLGHLLYYDHVEGGLVANGENACGLQNTNNSAPSVGHCNTLPHNYYASICSCVCVAMGTSGAP